MAAPDPRHRHTNRLAGETSPYLLQHAHNPVDWYPWGPEALGRAVELDRPIFLSIGYAACHWCHVMERESFEDEATAAVLNEHFVAIKVDREERPDLDALYMGAVQAMTGQGGWPMSVFLTPEGRPFFGGTYFPDTPRHGMPSFRQVLEGVRLAWFEQRAELEEAGTQLVAGARRAAAGRLGVVGPAARGRPGGGRRRHRRGLRPGQRRLGPRAQVPAADDDRGPAAAPRGRRRRHARCEIARRSLDAMAAGGIRDQLGGGFHRYSTDAHWLVPHFEQMLYDNAQLARVYVHAWALTGDARYLETATGTLDYLLRELRMPDGGFAASQDADTDGEEGATFVWSAAEIREVLGADAALFAAAYGVTDDGNWEGHTILSRIRDDASWGSGSGSSRGGGRAAGRGAAALLERRAARPQPARDDKVLAAWNGLAIGALADAARALGAARTRRRWTRRRPATATRPWRRPTGSRPRLLGADGRLRRSWKDGRATADGVLEDYANLAEGLLALYEATGDERWFAAAVGLADVILARFADPAGGFFDTADDGEPLVVRPKGTRGQRRPLRRRDGDAPSCCASPR